MFFYSIQATIEEKSLLENFTILNMKLTEKQGIFIHHKEFLFTKKILVSFLI